MVSFYLTIFLKLRIQNILKECSGLALTLSSVAICLKTNLSLKNKWISDKLVHEQNATEKACSLRIELLAISFPKFQSYIADLGIINVKTMDILCESWKGFVRIVFEKILESTFCDFEMTDVPTDLFSQMRFGNKSSKDGRFSI